jgi:hypothetical protein
VSEVYSFDAVHTKAAFFYADWNVRGPHVLADYLIPKNEKWLLVLPENQSDLNAYLKEWTTNGFNTCVMSYLGGPLFRSYRSKNAVN